MASKKLCVTFAGAIGSSKTPIAYHLSYNFGLLIFNNDTIRTEVAEDLGKYDEREFERRRIKRAKEVIERGNSFIYDCSVDRGWPKLKSSLMENGLGWFVVSLDLSKNFLLELYDVKGYRESAKRIDKLVSEHEVFLEKHNKDVNVHIVDNNFKDRLSIASKGLSKWLQ